MAPDEFLSVSGVVTQTRGLQKRDGSPYTIAVVTTAAGSTVDCAFWDPSLAPLEGENLSVSGKRMKNGSLSVQSVRIEASAGSPLTPEQRLLAYYRACLEAESARDRDLTPASRAVHLVSSGPSMLLTGEHTFDDEQATRSWTDARRQAGDAESVYVGFPIVSAPADGNMRIAPLFMADVSIAAVDESVTAKLRHSSLDLNPNALRLLGLDEEIDDLLDRFDALEFSSSPADQLLLALDFLARERISRPATADPRSLTAIASGLDLHNTQMFMVRDSGPEAFSRALLQDLESLGRESPESLRVGPLGVLLGHAEPGAAPDPAPTPAILQSNLHQELAVNSMASATLTVVTGPPGTGKTQVLVNAVAAAIDRGESVLLASKNNHAIDVVVERIRSTHPAAVPVRVGKASLREEAGQAMSAALADPAPDHPSIESARSAWATERDLVDRPYAAMRRRQTLELEVDDQQTRCDASAAFLPERLRTIDLARVPNREFLVVAHVDADRALKEAEALPRRWFWQRRRSRRAYAEATDLVNIACALAGSGAQPHLERALVDSGPQAALEILRAQIHYLADLEALEALRSELALLPSDEQAEQMIAASFETRLPTALELFGAQWHHRRRRGSPSRGAAKSVQTHLSTGKSLPRVVKADEFERATEVFPVWCSTSLAAGSSLPLSSGLFDLLVIDEAAQSDLASAIPLLFRAKRAAIVGDPHQLDHISTLSESADRHLAERHGLTDQQRIDFGYSDTSLYALAARRVDGEPILLNRHFRTHEDIISFSNRTFYSGQLVVETDPSMFMDGPALVWVDVAGEFERNRHGRSAINRPEAVEVLRVVGELWETLAGSGATIGVVSPFRAQVDLLRQLILDERRDLVDVVTVDTAHGFQGDERDVMVFSTVLAPSMSKGLIGHAGRSNLVNVSVTRARGKLVVVGDRQACIESEGVLARLAEHALGLEE